MTDTMTAAYSAGSPDYIWTVLREACRRTATANPGDPHATAGALRELVAHINATTPVYRDALVAGGCPDETTLADRLAAKFPDHQIPAAFEIAKRQVADAESRRQERAGVTR